MNSIKSKKKIVKRNKSSDYKIILLIVFWLKMESKIIIKTKL